MARATYVWRQGLGVIDKALAAPLHPAHGRGPMIIRDQMEPIASTLDGKVYDSKSSYVRDIKAQGYDVVGNERGWIDQQPRSEPSPVGPSIKRAIEELSSR